MSETNDPAAVPPTPTGWASGKAESVPERRQDLPPPPTNVEGWSLKPCPFCGGAAKLWGEDSTWAKLCRVSCTVCYASAGQYVETRAAAVENWNRRPAVLPTTSVEEARDDLARWVQSMNRVAFLVDVDALIALVRTEERAMCISNSRPNIAYFQSLARADERSATLAKVRAMVEGTPLPRDPSGMGISVDASDYKSNVLAGLAKMETP